MAQPRRPEAHKGSGASEHEIEDIENRSRLRAPIIYEIVREEGDEEMDRPVASLWWSGVAAGLSISFSPLAQASLFTLLPDRPWRGLISDFGYSVGFLIVVLARQQLFTENTLTVVLPVMAEFSRRNLLRAGRIWSLVLAANLTGTVIAAAFCIFSPAIDPAIRDAMITLSRQTLAHAPWEMLFRGITAGFLIAAMVWLIPSAKGSEFHVITLMTYLIAISQSAHIVAGGVEVFLLVFAGVADVPTVLIQFILPVLAGNIFGGTALFALLAYAQVMREI